MSTRDRIPQPEENIMSVRVVRGVVALVAMLALAGPALAQTPALINATSPGTVLSTVQSTAIVPVTISRDATTSLLGYSIKILVSPEFTAPSTATDFAIGSFMTFKPPSGTRLTDFHVVAGPGAGVYTIDGVALGADCGPIGTAGTLFTVTLRSAAASGTGTMTITSVSLRDCANTPVATTIGTAASVGIDNSPPTVTVTSPNSGETWVYQTTHDITWTAGDVGGGVANLDLDYSTNGGGTWTPIATGEANDGTYAWAIPNTPTTHALVRVTAHDVNANTTSDVSNAEFTILSNSAPVLGAIGNQLVNEGSALTFTATATDGEAPPQTLAFSLDAGAPATASINPTTGAFSWTPDEVDGPGNYPITVRVTDNGVPALNDFEAISVHVNEVNVAPVLAAIGNKTVNEETALTFTASATDADLGANTLTYSLDAGFPAGASIDPVTGVFSWTPTEAQGVGDYPITVRVTDNGVPPLNAFEAISVHVNEVNVAPVLAAIANQVASEGVLLTVNPVANDADVPANALTYSLTVAPSGASIDAGSGVITWTPGETDGGSNPTVTVRVTDNGSPVLFDEKSFTIAVSEANIAPVLSGVPTAVTIPELVAYTFTATATDPDVPANTLTFSLLGEPAGAAIGSASGVFTWTPTEAQGAGVYLFTVRVNDGLANNDAAITITVDDVTIAAISDLAVTLVRTGNDADGTIKLKLNWTATPGGTTVEVYRARFGHYPEYDDAGGVTPAAPTYPPTAPWEATAVTAPTQADEVSNGPSGYAGRDYWTYVAYVHGAGANVSTGSNRPARPNYFLGDVSDGTLPGLGRGNNVVDIGDISALGGSYGVNGAGVAAVNYLDVGPTSDNSVTGLPQTDNAINFEDLVLFAINYGNPPSPLLTTPPTDAVAVVSTDRVSIGARTAVQTGEEFAVPLTLAGTGRVQALSAALAWDAKVVEPIGMDAGAWLTGQEGVAFSPKPGAVDVALLGARSTGLAGEGVVATLRFRALTAGNPGITLATVAGRDAENRGVELDASVAPAIEAGPAITQLSPAYPNPFAGSTMIDFSLAKAGPVKVSVYAVNGRQLRVLANGAHAPGVYRLEWDGRDDQGRIMPAGLYFVQMSANGARFTNKMSRLR